MKEGRNPVYPEKPLATSFRKCHMLKPEDSSLKRDSNPHWWQDRKADMLTVTPRALHLLLLVVIDPCSYNSSTEVSCFRRASAI